MHVPKSRAFFEVGFVYNYCGKITLWEVCIFLKFLVECWPRNITRVDTFMQ